MAKAVRVRRCFHCGAILQSTNPRQPGFISKEIIENNKPDALLYCNKCYQQIRAINYSELEESVDDDILTVLEDAVATDAFIIWVVDLFAFNGTLNPKITKAIKNLKIAVIGTKRDLFPKTIKDETFIRYLKERFSEFHIKPHSISIFGHESKIQGDKLIEKLHQARQGHDVYMIGTATSGKTSIINKVMKSFENKSQWPIKSEIYPNTKIKVLEIPLSNSSFFYELPGLSLDTSACSKIEKDLVKIITPKKHVHISPRLMKSDETLLIGNLVGFTLVKGRTTAVKCYTSEQVEVRKVKTSQVKEATQENLRRRIYLPVSENINDFNDYDVFEYAMENDDKLHDISIFGLCWFSFIAKGQVFRVYLPKGVALKESFSKVR